MSTGFKKIYFIALILLLAKINAYSQFTVTSTTACPNQTATLTASWNNVGNITYTISRTAPASTVQTSPNFVVSDPGPGPTTVVYSFTAQGTALSGPVTATATATLTIIAPPALALTQPNGGNYCHNNTATITAPVGSVFSYSVVGPANTSTITSNSNIINIPNLFAPAYTGQYTVTANIAGCVRRGITQVNVAPNSLITTNVSTLTGLSLCQGSNTNLTATLLNADLASMYWTRPDNSVVFSTPNAATLPINNAQASASGVYKVNSNFFFNSISCPAPTATANVIVVQTSSIAITATPGKTLCQNASVTLNASLLNNVPTAPVYSWVGPLYNASQQSPTLTGLTQINSGFYTVTALFYNNFINCPVTQAIEIVVIPTAIPNPVAPPNVCQGEPSTPLSANSAVAPTFWSWSGPNGFTATTSNTTILNIQPIQSGPYFVTATYGTAATTLCALTRSVVINVVPVNTITVIPPADVCQPDNAYLQASAVGATSFTWTGPNGPVGSTPNVTIYHPTPGASGIYTINMGFGGSALTCYNSTTVSITVKPLLIFSLPPLINSPFCVGDTLRIAGPPGATSYAWTSSTGYNSTTQNVMLFPLGEVDSGDYILTVSLNGCITSASTSIRVTAPIDVRTIPDRVICRGDSIHLAAQVTGGRDFLSARWEPSVYLTTPNSLETDARPLGTTIYSIRIHDPACPHFSIFASTKVTVNQPPEPHLTLEKTESCEPLCLFYDTQTHGTSTLVTYDFGGNKKYQLDSSMICLENPGTYNLNVHLYGVNGCTVSYNYPNPITVYPKPGSEIIVTPESPTITDEVVYTAITKHPSSSYNWLVSTSMLSAPDTLAQQSFMTRYQDPGKYPILLITTTEQGCSDTVVKFIDIKENYNVFIPNTFTPNGDGVNDLFQVNGTSLMAERFSMELTNRWGKAMYFTKDINQGWDGTNGGAKAPMDVYIYRIRVVGANGEGLKEYVGRFNLLR